MRPLRCSVVVQCGGFPQVTQVAQKYAAKLEFVKRLRLPENTSNVNIETTGKEKNCIIYTASWSSDTSSFLLF